MTGTTADAMNFRDALVKLPRVYRRLIWIVADIVVLSAVLGLALSIRREGFVLPNAAQLNPWLLTAPLISVASLTYFRLYRVIARYIAYGGNVTIAAGMAVSVIMWMQLVGFTSATPVPSSQAVIYLLAGTFALISARHFAGWLLADSIRSARGLAAQQLTPVVIFGTGPMAVQLFQSLQFGNRHDVVAFIDNTAACSGQYVGGVKIHSPSKLPRLIERCGVKEILLAMPGMPRADMRAILAALEAHPVTVKKVPELSDIAMGSVEISDLKPVDVEDLLGRAPVPPDPLLMARSTKNKCIFVTGAGGSVGSELARQIVDLEPAALVLLDVSEEGLYRIELELAERIARIPAGVPRPRLVPVLGSVLDEALIARTLSRYGIHTVYHAAAYKHVPLVELNPFAGFANNVLGAETVARAARKHGVERVVLISTDKAVRPTNVMGATKRLAELALQAIASDPGSTIFTMVRFGNVLGSSGSVVPRFRKQIEDGGPITVTHPDIIRYFMTIKEAAELVIQAGSMARGGELFLLEMGDPVKIDTLARLLVSLVGLDVRSESNPDGDIEIVYTGLRPGEKLQEELLLAGAKSATEHERIFKSEEPVPSVVAIQRQLERLRTAIDHRDMDLALDVMVALVEGYRPSQSISAETGATAGSGATWAQAEWTLH